MSAAKLPSARPGQQEREACVLDEPVNLVEEHRELAARLESLTTQESDLRAAIAATEELIGRLEADIAGRFSSAFSAIGAKFDEFCRLLFDGGSASLQMADGNEQYKPSEAGLHLYVPDADAVYRRALEAGGVSLSAPVDQPYGDREAGVKDPCGNSWWIATHKTGSHIPAGMHAVTPFLHPKGAPKLIEFLTDGLWIGRLR